MIQWMAFLAVEILKSVICAESAPDRYAHGLTLKLLVNLNIRVRNCAFLVANAIKILHWRPEFHNWSPAGD